MKKYEELIIEVCAWIICITLVIVMFKILNNI